MTLSANQIKLLNDFAKTQIALNEVGVPYPQSGIQLGDVLHALEVAVAANPPEVSDAVYGAGWNGDLLHAPSKNAIYDKMELVIGTIPPAVSDIAYAASWDGVTTIAPSKNAVYDEVQTVIGLIPTLPTVARTTTSAIGEIPFPGMTGTGAVLVTALADPGVGSFYSHTVCGIDKITVYIKDTATGTAALSNALLVAYQIVQLI